MEGRVVRLGTISSRRETKIRIFGRQPPPAAKRTLGNCATTTTFLTEELLSPPPFQWSLPVGGASAAPPIRADVANGGSGHLFRQPRGGEPRRGSRCGGAIAARRRVGSRAAPSDPARQRPASVTDAAPTLPDASARWERRLAAFLRFEAARGVRELLRDLVGWREGGECPMCALCGLVWGGIN